MKVLLVVLSLAVAAIALPHTNSLSASGSDESGELEVKPYKVDEHHDDDSYKVDDDRFDGASKRFHTEVSDDDAPVDIFRSHHQYVQDDGTIIGEYAVLAPDQKTLQIVKYTAGKAGYNAKVAYTDDLSVF